MWPFTKSEALELKKILAPTSSSTFPHLPAGVLFSNQEVNYLSETSAAFNGVSK